jgi:MoaA/NifB/PqqE/SkfB family radical SAM enzyme
MKSVLNIKLVNSALEAAFNMGYQHLAISGGEPLLYPNLKELLDSAKYIGMRTSLITNGSFSESKYAEMQGLLDSIAVSIDGSQDLHNQVRANKSSFQKVDKFLDFSQKYFSNTGIAFSLSDQSWEMIPQMLDYAKSKSVDLFQIHPLESIGRANNQNLISLSNGNLKRAYILTKALQCQYPFPIQFDAFNSRTASNTLLPNINNEQASDVIDLLVLAESGIILPYSYGIPSKWQVANLHKQGLTEGWNSFRETKLDDFYSWCQKTLENQSELIFTPSKALIHDKLEPNLTH